MPDTSFGSPTHLDSYVLSGTGPTSSGLVIPTGRPHLTGSRRVAIVGVAAYLAGRGAAQLGRIRLGNERTGQFTVAAGSSAVSTGMKAVDTFTGEPGSNMDILLGFTGVYYGWGGSGSTNDGYSTIRPGMLAGSFRWRQAPADPSITDLSSYLDGTKLNVQWTFAGQDDGGSPVSSYRVQVANNQAFTSGVKTVVATGNNVTVGGMTPGQRVYARVAAQNGVTDLVGSGGGSWSSIGTAVMSVPEADDTYGKIFDGTSFVAADARIFNGTAWVPADGRIFNGTAWVPLG